MGASNLWAREGFGWGFGRNDLDEPEHFNRLDVVRGRVLPEAGLCAGIASRLVRAISDEVFNASALAVVA